MSTCGAWAERWVSSGPERKHFAGPCQLDLGHEPPHVPPGLLNTGFSQVPTDQLNEAQQLVDDIVHGGGVISTETGDQARRLADLLHGWS